MKAIIVLGATATGKSSLALEIALKTNGVIINCDSVQFYEPLRIGSASPTEDDLAKAPHYLYSYVKPPVEMTAGDFLREFHKLIEDEKFKQDNVGRPLIIVGGTGFYIQALEKGMFNVPQIDPELKIQIEHEILIEGNEKAYQELIEFDPETKIHVNDGYRIGRALELKRAFNLKMSDIQKQAQMDTKFKLPYPYIKIGTDLDKEQLFENIRRRTETMLKQGLIAETQSMIDKGFAEWAPLNSVGYFEVKEFLQGRIAKDELEPLINRSTQQLTKKQKTWFKRDAEIHWVNPTQRSQVIQVFEKIEEFIES